MRGPELASGAGRADFALFALNPLVHPAGPGHSARIFNGQTTRNLDVVWTPQAFLKRFKSCFHKNGNDYISSDNVIRRLSGIRAIETALRSGTDRIQYAVHERFQSWSFLRIAGQLR